MGSFQPIISPFFGITFTNWTMLDKLELKTPSPAVNEQNKTQMLAQNTDKRCLGEKIGGLCLLRALADRSDK